MDFMSFTVKEDMCPGLCSCSAQAGAGLINAHMAVITANMGMSSCGTGVCMRRFCGLACKGFWLVPGLVGWCLQLCSP